MGRNNNWWGSAGSTAARYSAKEGVSVLVLDGKKEIGEPLQCGELIPSVDELQRLCLTFPRWMIYFKPQRVQYRLELKN